MKILPIGDEFKDSRPSQEGLGKLIDRRLTLIKGQFDYDDLDNLEFEDPIETFEKFNRVKKRGARR